MNVISVLRKSGLTAARLLTMAICMASVGVMLDVPGLTATHALARDGEDDGGSDDSGDDHGGDHGGEDHDADDDNGGDRGDDDATGTPGSGSGSACDDASISLDLHYADGFHEHVSGCTYVLTDQHGRVVVTRSATQHDLERLDELTD